MIPVHLISGFLGAGKTTAILELLSRKPTGEQWAIVINEFGKISIDGKILAASATGQSVFEISGGCICCSAKAYFLEDMEKIVQTGRFDRIIVEPSGLGGTDHITELAAQHPGLQLMPVICLIDITMTANPRLKMLPIYKSQILKADLVLFTKSELLTEQELKMLTEKFEADFPGKNCQLKTQFDFHWSLQKEGTPQNAGILQDEGTQGAEEFEGHEQGITNEQQSDAEEFFLAEKNVEAGGRLKPKEHTETENCVDTKERIVTGNSSLTDLRPWKIVDRHSCKEFCLTIPFGKTINIQNLKEILKNEKSILRAKGYIYSGNEWLLFNHTLSGLTTEKCQPLTSNELAIIFESTDKELINSFGEKIAALFHND